MKKSLFTLAAAVVVFASCTSDDLLVDEQVQSNNETAIGFSTYSNKTTRAAENSGEDYTLDLKDHHENFAVWGYKNTETARVFNDQLVEWKSSAWSYSPARFWDKAADNYEFYAAAPRTDLNGAKIAWTLNGDETIAKQANHYFTLGSVRMYGSNLSTVTDNADKYVESFATAPAVNSKKDVDLMIADKKSVATTSFTSTPVELDFIHILSRMNVTIKTTLASPAVVTLKSLEINGLKCTGEFSEATNAVSTGTTTRWTTGSEGYVLAAKTDYTVKKPESTDKDLYVLQSLVIPQEAGVENIKLDGTAASVNGVTYTAYSAATTPYIKIVYTIDSDGDGTDVAPETFTAYYNLATVFGITGTNKLAFNEGWMNTLNVTIDPTAITFTGKVAKWDEDKNSDLNVQ